MEILALVGVAVGTAVLVGWRIYVSGDRGRARRMAPVTVARFPDGAVGKIVGRIGWSGEPLKALLSRRSCVYYEAARLSDSEAPGPTGLVSAGQDFLVEDATGSALVRFEGARVVGLPREQRSTPAVIERESMDSADLARLDEWAEFSKQGWRGFDEGSLLEEGLISEGDEVSVVGYGLWEPDPDPTAATGGYRDGATRLVMASTKKRRLLISYFKKTR